MRGCTGHNCLLLHIFIFLSLQCRSTTAIPLLNTTATSLSNDPSFHVEIREGRTPVDQISIYIAMIRAMTSLAWQGWSSNSDPKVYDYRTVRLVVETSPPGEGTIRNKYAVMALFQAAAYYRSVDPATNARFVGRFDTVPEVELWFLLSDRVNDFTSTLANYTDVPSPAPAALVTLDDVEVSSRYTGTNESSADDIDAPDTYLNRNVQAYKRATDHDSDTPPDTTFPSTNLTTTTSTNLTSPPDILTSTLDITVTFLDTSTITPPNFYFAIIGGLQSMSLETRSAPIPGQSIIATDCPVYVKVRPSSTTARRLTVAMVIRTLVKAAEESLRQGRQNHFRARVYDVVEGTGQRVELGKVELIRTANRGGGGRPLGPGYGGEVS